MLQGTVVGEEYYPLGSTQFGSLISKIKKLKKPDAICSIVVGGSERGATNASPQASMAKHHALTNSVTEDEAWASAVENLEGSFVQILPIHRQRTAKSSLEIA